MVIYLMKYEPPPRRSPRSQLPTLNCSSYNSFALTLLADPHPSTPIESNFYKNHRGEGASTFQSPSPISFTLSHYPSRLFRMCTCKSVSKQATLTFFRMNTYEKHRGEGGVIVNQIPMRESVLRSIATKDLSSNPNKDFYPRRQALFASPDSSGPSGPQQETVMTNSSSGHLHESGKERV
jgi:hypothetical protein